LNNHVNIYIYIYIYTHTHIESHSKTNRPKFLFPKNGYNVRIKVLHILNTPPFCDVLISLLQRAFKSELAARVSDFNRQLPPLKKHILLLLLLLLLFLLLLILLLLLRVLTKYTDIYFFIEDSTIMLVKSCWLEINY
jgi:hypothetical protein